MIFHDPDRPDADWTEEAETLPMRPRLLSFHAVEALLDAAFPQTRQARQLRRKRATRRSEIEIPTGIRPDLTMSAALSKLNHVLTTEPTIREKPPDRSGVVRAVSKKNATWLAWVVRVPAAVALGILFGTLIAIFLYGEDIVFRDLESAVDAPPPRASVEPTPAGPPPPMPVAVSPAPEAGPPEPPPVKKTEKVKKAAATASTSKEKTKDTKVTTPPKAARPEPPRPEPARLEPPRLEARAPQTPPPVANKVPPPSSSAQVDDKAMKREKALAEAARKLAEGQLSQSLAR